MPHEDSRKCRIQKNVDTYYRESRMRCTFCILISRGESLVSTRSQNLMCDYHFNTALRLVHSREEVYHFARRFKYHLRERRKVEKIIAALQQDTESRKETLYAFSGDSDIVICDGLINKFYILMDRLLPSIKQHDTQMEYWRKELFRN
jgi:hypothetical protein